MNHSDSRFYDHDPTLVLISGVLATVAGPGSMVLAWCMYTRQPNRFVTGILVCTVEVFSQILYYGVEVLSGLHNVRRIGSASFAACFIVYNTLRTVIPLSILIKFMIMAAQSAEADDFRTRRLSQHVQSRKESAAFKEMLRHLRTDTHTRTRIHEFQNPNDPSSKWFFEVKDEVDRIQTWLKSSEIQCDTEQGEEAKCSLEENYCAHGPGTTSPISSDGEGRGYFYSL